MDVSLVPVLLNFGLGGAVIFLIATGILVPGFIYKELQKAYDKRGDALAVERQRNADLQQMAATGAKALDALAQLAEEQRRAGEAAMKNRAPPSVSAGQQGSGLP